jgi:outer membrane protein assembly factor BamE (lipoprotein component of BamABCDE complex)
MKRKLSQSRVVWGVIAVTSALAACIALPIPSEGYSVLSRGNLPSQPPQFLKVGVTTREEVLLQLGSPDSLANNHSWFGYRSISHEGGATVGNMLFIPFRTDVVYTRQRELVIYFNSDSTVERFDFKEASCNTGTGKCGVVSGKACIWPEAWPKPYNTNLSNPAACLGE